MSHSSAAGVDPLNGNLPLTLAVPFFKSVYLISESVSWSDEGWSYNTTSTQPGPLRPRLCLHPERMSGEEEEETVPVVAFKDSFKRIFLMLSLNHQSSIISLRRRRQHESMCDR